VFKKYPVINISVGQKRNIELFNMAIKEGKYKLEEVSCNLCGSNKRKVLFKNDRYGINQDTVICMECGLVYSSPRLTTDSTIKFYSSDEYRHIYEGESTEKIFFNRYRNAINYKYDTSNSQQYKELIFVDFLNKSGITFNSVCEVGAGGGTNLIPFKRMGKEVMGIDYSEKLVSLGNKEGINMMQGSIADMDKPYDLVNLIHVLEHFLDPVGQIKQLSKNVNRYLFIEVPGIINKFPSLQNAHLYYFSINTLFSCIYRAGFKAIDYKVIDSNNYIMALFKKSSNSVYYYNFPDEICHALGIVRKFKGKNFIKNIIRGLPFGDKLFNNIKSFFKKSKARNS